jgi:hypothetical protein
MNQDVLSEMMKHMDFHTLINFSHTSNTNYNMVHQYIKNSEESFLKNLIITNRKYEVYFKEPIDLKTLPYKINYKVKTKKYYINDYYDGMKIKIYNRMMIVSTCINNIHKLNNYFNRRNILVDYKLKPVSVTLSSYDDFKYDYFNYCHSNRPHCYYTGHLFATKNVSIMRFSESSIIKYKNFHDFYFVYNHLKI